MSSQKNKQWQVAAIMIGALLFVVLSFVVFFLGYDRIFGDKPIEPLAIRLGFVGFILVYFGFVLWVSLRLISLAMSIDHFDKLERMQNESQTMVSIDTEEFPKKVLDTMERDGYQLETKTIQIDNNIMEIQIAQKKITRKWLIPYLSYFVFINTMQPGVVIDTLLEKVTEEIDRSKLVKSERMVQFSVCFIEDFLTKEIREFCQTVYWDQPPQFVFLPIGVDLRSSTMISLQGCKGISKDLRRHMDAIQHYFFEV